MSDTTHPQIIVITEEKRKRRGLLWAAGGAALLLAGGSTFALWSASDTFTGGTITAGDLDLASAEETSFWDVSSDRIDATATVPGTDGSTLGHAIDSIAEWRIVPGDTVAVAFGATVTLDGDNLVARLGIDGLDALDATGLGLEYEYEVYYDDALLVERSALPTAADAPLLYLSATPTGQEAGGEDATVPLPAAAVDGTTAQTTVFGLPGDTDVFSIVIYGTFDAGTEDRELVTASDILADLTLALAQVRDTGAQFD